MKELTVTIHAGMYGDGSGKIIINNARKAAEDAGMLAHFSATHGIENYRDAAIYHCNAFYALPTIEELASLPPESRPIILLQRDSAHVTIQMDLMMDEIRATRPPEVVQAEIHALLHRTDVPRQLREYELADYILIASEFERDSFLEVDKSFERKLVKVPFTCNVNDYLPEEGKFDPERRLKITWPGGSPIRKGLTYFKKICKELQSYGIEFDVLKGDDSWVDHITMKSILAKAHILVLPGAEDGYPMAVMEAMSSECVPIVSSNIGVKDIIINPAFPLHTANGFVIENYRDVRKFSGIIDFLSEDREALFQKLYP